MASKKKGSAGADDSVFNRLYTPKQRAREVKPQPEEISAVHAENYLDRGDFGELSESVANEHEPVVMSRPVEESVAAPKRKVTKKDERIPKISKPPSKEGRQERV